MKLDQPTFAVLIDADHDSLKSISPVLTDISRRGRCIVRRIYGDFTDPQMAGWRDKLTEHAIQPVQQYRNSMDRNASASSLIIDAMDLLHTQRFDGFCLVSSDSDFTRLATRIREEGLMVFGYGRRHTADGFVSACDRFGYLEDLMASPLDVSVSGLRLQDARGPANMAGLPVALKVAEAPAAFTYSVAAPATAEAPPRPLTQAMGLLLEAYHELEAEDGWVMVIHLFAKIRSLHAGFSAGQFGQDGDLALLRHSEAFDIELRPHKKGKSYFCRPLRYVPRNVSLANRHALAQACREALVEAVRRATAANGWAPITAIGQQFKALGHSIQSAGHATLTDALNASGVFEMKGSGAARYFRLKSEAAAGG